MPAVSRTTVLRQRLLVGGQATLTEVKVKTRIQPKEPTRFEDVTYSGGSTRRFDQLDSLLLCYRVFQLPPNLQTFVNS